MMASSRQRHLLYETLLALDDGGPRGARSRPTPAQPGGNFQPLRPVAPVRWARGEEPASPPRRVLGISAFYHDAAAALVVDGVPVVAIQEERLSRTKNDRMLPRRAIAACLRYAGLRIDEIDALAFYEEPFLKLDRLLRTAIALRPGFQALEAQGWFDAVERNLTISSSLAHEVGFGGPIAFVQHHQSHAASAFLASPFKLAACLVIDGVGEWASTTLAYGEGSRIDLLAEVRFPHSLGLLYSTVTAYLGFAVNSDEYKVMALAAAGRPTFKRVLAQVIEIFPDGSVRDRPIPPLLSQ
jgi:carbamoyltransferase